MAASRFASRNRRPLSYGVVECFFRCFSRVVGGKRFDVLYLLPKDPDLVEAMRFRTAITCT
jgi:hypothetical protein